MRRVVITGLGAVSALGNTVAETWEGIKAGRCGIEKITVNYDPGDDRVRIAAECKEFDPTAFMDKKDARKMARFSQFAVAAAVQAVADAGLSNETIEGDRTGVMIGNGIGGFEIHESSFKKYFEAGHSRIPPLAIPLLIPNEAAGNISMRFGLHGVSWTITTACASGTDALGNALDLIRSGRMDMCLAGGTEAAITGFGINAFSVLQTLAADYNDEPHKACCPFDKKRSGFVMGEGSGILILEEWEHAVARGAHIYAELAGYGTNGDAYHITAPRPGGTIQVACMQKALADAGLTPDTISYINAHGTSTHLNDLTETTSIKQLLGDKAYDVPVSSTKSMMGHLLGAAGAVEAIVCALAVENDKIPPTINCKEREAECDLDYVTEGAREVKVDVAMSNAFGFGGHNAVLVMRKPK